MPEVPSPSTETKKLRYLDALFRFWVGWAGKVLPPVLGLGLTVYCVQHIVEETGTASMAHLAVVALFGVLGLVIAAGQRALAGLAAVTTGLRAWRSSGDKP